MANPDWALEQSALAARRDAVALRSGPLLAAREEALATCDWSSVTRLTNQLTLLSKAETARDNSTQSVNPAIASWRAKTDVNPLRFHALTLAFSLFLGGHRKMAAARRHALLLLRPDLFLEECSGTPYRRAKAIERQDAIIGKLKGAVEKPRGALRPLFDKITHTWVIAIS